VITASDAVAAALADMRPRVREPIVAVDAWESANSVVVFMAPQSGGADFAGLGPVIVDRTNGGLRYVPSSTDPEMVTRNMTKVQL
jgi:hypothetical protein